MATVIAVSFGQKERSVNDFKLIKKSIDTLVIVNPFVKIQVKNFNAAPTIDYFESEKITKQIANQTIKFLGKKYNTELNTLASFNDSLYLNEINQVILKLNESKNPINSIKIPETLLDLINLSKNRYFLSVLFIGHYTYGISPYEKVTGSKIYLNPGSIAKSNIYIFLADKEKNEIIYYASSQSSDDPRVPDMNERLISKTIKTLYYK